MVRIGTGIKLGGLFLVAKEGMKIYEKHQQKGQSPMQQPIQQGQYRDQPQQLRDESGYLHQTWSNGECYHQCNGSPSTAVRDVRNVEADRYPSEKTRDEKLPAY